MVKIQKLPSGQLVITLPKLLAEYEGLKKGMELDFKKHKDGFILEIKRNNSEASDIKILNKKRKGWGNWK